MGIEPTSEAWEARNKNREYVLKSGAVEPGEPVDIYPDSEIHFRPRVRDVDWFCQSNCREKERPPVCLGRRLFSNPQPNPQSAMSCTTYA